MNFPEWETGTTSTKQRLLRDSLSVALIGWLVDVDQLVGPHSKAQEEVHEQERQQQGGHREVDQAQQGEDHQVWGTAKNV